MPESSSIRIAHLCKAALLVTLDFNHIVENTIVMPMGGTMSLDWLLLPDTMAFFMIACGLMSFFMLMFVTRAPYGRCVVYMQHHSDP